MNTKDFVRLGVPLGETTRRATDFVAMVLVDDRQVIDYSASTH